MSDENDIFRRADEVLGLFTRGAEFTRQLLLLFKRTDT